MTIDEIAKVVRQHHGEIEITLAAEAAEYRKTLAFLQGDQTTPAKEVSFESGSRAVREVIQFPEEVRNG